MDASQRCEEFLPLLREDAIEALQGLGFYLKTLEEFVARKKSMEVTDLERFGDRLPLNQQGEFWAWHYPVHWDDIFASQLRSSFVVTLISLVESHVGMVADQVCKIANIQTTHNKNDLLGRNRKFFKSLDGFSRPTEDNWNDICQIRDVRNCIVHANSRINRSNKQIYLRSLLHRLPGLSATYDVIDMSQEFPNYALHKVKDFIFVMYKEFSIFCNKLK